MTIKKTARRDIARELPLGWVASTLGEVTLLRSERVLPSREPQLPYIGLEQVEAHTSRILTTIPASSVTSTAVRFKAGDVLYGRMRPYLNKVVQPDFDGLASAEFIVFAATLHLNSTFLKLRLTSPDFVEFACAQISGDRPRVKFEQLARFDFALPPVEEQARIVEKLTVVLAGLDSGVVDLREVQSKLQQYRQSLLKAAVTGELTAEWREERATPLEDVRTSAELLQEILAVRRVRWNELQLSRFRAQEKAMPEGWQKKYVDPEKANTTNLPALPTSWTWATLNQLTEIQGGIQKQPTRAPLNNKFPYLRVANVARGELRLDEVHEVELFPGELERFSLKVGDLLIVEGNGSLTEIGRCAVWNGEIKDAVHQNHLIRARPILISSLYLSAWLNSPQGMDILAALAATTSGLYTLSVGKIGKIPVPLPPLDEQGQIESSLTFSFLQISKQSELASESIRQAEIQRRNILQTAFSGQLVSQDSTDEPARELLIRVQAERQLLAARSKKKGMAGSKKEAVEKITMQKIYDALKSVEGWIAAEQIFQLCGVTDGTDINRLEELYSELRQLDRDQVIETRRVGQFDELRVRPGGEHAAG